MNSHRVLTERLDQICAELSDIANEMPLSDAQMCVRSAKDSLTMAQDFIEKHQHPSAPRPLYWIGKFGNAKKKHA